MRDMLVERHRDDTRLVSVRREVHALCDEHSDVASVNLLESWINEAEGRVWFLAETLG